MSIQAAVIDPIEIVRKNKGWFTTLSIVLIVLGFAAILLPHVASVTVEMLAGWVFLIGGIANLIHAIKSKGHSSFWMIFIVSIIYLFAGVLLLRYPLQGVMTLTMLLAICFVVGGIFRIILAFNAKPMGAWGWILMNGIVSLVLGLIIWAGLPGSAAWAIGLIVGIDMLFAGWAMLMMSSAVKKA